MSKLDLQVVQDNYTDFVIYDNSNRGYNPNVYMDFEDVRNLTSIVVKFTSKSPFFKENYYTVEIAKEENLSDPILELFNSQIAFDFSNMTVQEDFQITIPRDTFEEEILNKGLIPEGLWEIEFLVDGDNSIADTLQEYSFKQTEIYREQLFLFIGRNTGEFNPYYAAHKTKKDKFRMQVLWFDANFKALKTQIEVGNTTFVDKTLKWLIDFQCYNPIDKILQTND